MPFFMTSKRNKNPSMLLRDKKPIVLDKINKSRCHSGQQKVKISNIFKPFKWPQNSNSLNAIKYVT